MNDEIIKLESQLWRITEQQLLLNQQHQKLEEQKRATYDQLVMARKSIKEKSE